VAEISSGRNLTLSLVHPRLGRGTNFGQRVTGHTPGRIDQNGTVHAVRVVPVALQSKSLVSEELVIIEFKDIIKYYRIV